MSSSNFFALLDKRVGSINSILCVGLDPHVSQLEAPTVDEAKKFCLNIISQTGCSFTQILMK